LVAETPGVFFPRVAPIELNESRLMGLRVSLNTPVVSTESLAVGPARAGLLVHLEPGGRRGLTVAVRSIRTGEVVLYSFEGDLADPGALSVGIDGALSFAESMGFLFDEDEVAGGGPARALRLWNELTGQGPVEAEEPEAEELVEGAELLLDELADESLAVVAKQDSEAELPDFPQFEGDVGFGEASLPGEGFDPSGFDVSEGGGLAAFDSRNGLDPETFQVGGAAHDAFAGDAPASGRGASRPSAGESGVPLSKFRAAFDPGPAEPDGAPSGDERRLDPTSDSAPDAASPSDAGRTTLARLRLVRRGRKDGRAHPILRLFGAF
jgi:hypothetical protein